MNLLSRDAILGADDIRSEIVSVPEWGGDVRVATLSGAQRDDFEMAIVESKGKGGSLRARLVAACVIDEAGEPMFSQKDVAALGKKSGKALDRVFSVAQKLAGLTDGDVEELEGN